MGGGAFFPVQVVVRGAGDLGSGVVYRLNRCGFPVIVLELSQPLLVRRAVAYGSAVFEETVTIEGLVARRVDGWEEAFVIQKAGGIPVLVDPEGATLSEFNPTVVIDARMAKCNLDTHITDAPLVIGLGPGFTAGVDCHAVIETNRGHFLGRVIWEGQAEPDTHMPGQVSEYRSQRVLRAPADGTMRGLGAIGDAVVPGQPVAEIRGKMIRAPFEGVLRGLLHDGLYVAAGTKVGDVDPRSHREHCFTISEKSLAIGGGVLEAVFSSAVVREQLQQS